MANVRLGGGVADIRGSIGGSTFSRSKAGATMRARVKGTTSRSSSLQARKASLSMLSSYWGTTLTQEQRDAWNLYASQTPMMNRLGQPMYITGMAAFIQTNGTIAPAGEAIRATAPATPGAAVTPAFAATIDSESAELSITAAPTGWDSSDPAAVLIWRVSPATPPGRSGVNKRLAYAGKVKGNNTPPTFPLAIAMPYATAAGAVHTVECVQVDADGKVSAKSVITVTAAHP